MSDFLRHVMASVSGAIGGARIASENTDAKIKDLEARLVVDSETGTALALSNTVSGPAGLKTAGKSNEVSRADHSHGVPSFLDVGALSEAEKGAPGGVASLDEEGKLIRSQVPSAEDLGLLRRDVAGTANNPPLLDADGHLPLKHIPLSLFGVFNFLGEWDALNNFPALPNAASVPAGSYYVVTTAGGHSVDGVSEWKLRDWVVAKGTYWIKVGSSADVILPITKTERESKILASNFLYRDTDLRKLYYGDGVTVGGIRVGGSRFSVRRTAFTASATKSLSLPSTCLVFLSFRLENYALTSSYGNTVYSFTVDGSVQATATVEAAGAVSGDNVVQFYVKGVTGSPFFSQVRTLAAGLHTFAVSRNNSIVAASGLIEVYVVETEESDFLSGTW